MSQQAWKPRSSELCAALREHFIPQAALRAGMEEWALLTEVPSTGSPYHERSANGPRAEDYGGYMTDAWRDALTEWSARGKVRSIDVLLLRNWSGKPNPFERIAVEIKVSRADFFRDSAAKRGPWEALTHRFAYCVPAGLVSPDEVPDGCWLLEVTEMPCEACSRGHSHAATRVHWNRKVRGARRKPAALPNELGHLIARRASRAETRLGDEADATMGSGATTFALDKAVKRVAALESRAANLEQRVRAMAELVTPFGPQLCGHCLEEIRPRVDRYARATWVHRKAEHEQACALTRGRWAYVTPKVLTDFDWEMQELHDGERAEVAELRDAVQRARRI